MVYFQLFSSTVDYGTCALLLPKKMQENSENVRRVRSPKYTACLLPRFLPKLPFHFFASGAARPDRLTHFVLTPHPISIASMTIPAPSTGVSNPHPSTLSRIGVSGRFFVDTDRRVRLFHGFNDVGEATRRVGPFDGFNYLPQVLIGNLTRLDILINEYGFNCFRVGAIWAALQPAPNVTDDRYLTALRNATRLLAEHGAYSILDMHQARSCMPTQSLPRSQLLRLTALQHPRLPPHPHVATRRPAALTPRTPLAL